MAAAAAPMRRGAAMDKDAKEDALADRDEAAGLAMAEGKAGNAKGGEFQQKKQAGAGEAGGGRPGPGPDLSQVAARKNLNETAFFFPHLLSDSEGRVKLEFSMPEALTKWKFMGFAHDAQLARRPVDR